MVALTFVAAPFYLRQAIAAFEAVDPALLDASRTLGAVAGAHVLRASRSPTALPGLVAGTALALGRALGEFGATLMFAGSFQGITQTVPLAIYDRFATDFTAALALSAVLVAVSAAILLSVKLVRRPGRGGAMTAGCPWRPHAARRRRSSSTSSSRWRRGSASRWPGPSGAGKTSVLRIGRRAARARRAGRVACGDETLARHGARHRRRRPSGGAAATCSRSTRCSGT